MSLALHDLQLSQMKESSGQFQALSDPIPIFEFDFGKHGKESIAKRRQSVKVFTPKLTVGKCDAIFMWWDLEMDPKSEIVLSCAPTWAHPRAKSFQGEPAVSRT